MRSIYIKMAKSFNLQQQIIRGKIKYKSKRKLKKHNWNVGRNFNGKTITDIQELLFPDKIGTDFIKFAVQQWVDILTPSISAIVIKEADFAKFLTAQGAKDNSWTLRFWEIDHKEGYSKSIAVWKETPNIWKTIQSAMRGKKRGTTWAGVEFTDAVYGLRVAMYRYPTAGVWGIGKSAFIKDFQKIQRAFENFF